MSLLSRLLRRCQTEGDREAEAAVAQIVIEAAKTWPDMCFEVCTSWELRGGQVVRSYWVEPLREREGKCPAPSAKGASS